MKERLFLILKRNCFEMIRLGEKTFEYRKYCPHWKKYIWDKKDVLKSVVFQLGYNKTHRMEFEIKEILDYNPAFEKVHYPNPLDNKGLRFGFDNNIRQYTIKLGKRLDK